MGKKDPKKILRDESLETLEEVFRARRKPFKNGKKKPAESTCDDETKCKKVWAWYDESDTEAKKKKRTSPNLKTRRTRTTRRNFFWHRKIPQRRMVSRTTGRKSPQRISRTNP